MRPLWGAQDMSLENDEMQSVTASGHLAPSILIEPFARLRDAYKTWRRASELYNRTYEELSSCSARELADIGIARADIPRIAREHVELHLHR